ncbi:hypothetical protein [Nocardia sp. NPDC019395]|uniref:hypothetical protein n=1 Tax=Nocardia sp. NPDC019395 TaxID=3154686 RepID=UPI0033FFC37A
MTAAILAAATGILGIAIGRLWDSRSEAARWRRDQMTASYQSFADQFESMYEAIRAIALTDLTAEELPTVIQDARTNNFIPWDSALAAVWLHGSKEVVTAATLVDRAILDIFHAAPERQFTIDDWNQVRGPAREAFERFIRAARTELHLPAVEVTLFPESPPRLEFEASGWGLPWRGDSRRQNTPLPPT